jgi:hypothetical protein
MSNCRRITHRSRFKPLAAMLSSPYVLHQEGAQFEPDGPGIDFVDIVRSSGRLLRRLERGDWLNAPWGLLWLRSILDASATIC